jgi:hypothetical protein
MRPATLFPAAPAMPMTQKSVLLRRNIFIQAIAKPLYLKVFSLQD